MSQSVDQPTGQLVDQLVGQPNGQPIGQPTDQPPIARIGKYQIVRRLGGGGMAEVFAARLLGVEGFARPVALKRVLPGYAQDRSFASMFIREAQLSARFNHPNVVSVVDFDRDPEHGLFLAMELVEGRDLSDLMQTGLLPISVVIHLVAEILRGLGYAHNLPPDDSGVRGVIHRDVSPHNVLLSWEGAVKVSDFGIAKARGAATSASASVMIKGKPAYMSPEQANGAKLDGRSDLFAVGIMLWEMLVGRPLFAGSGTMQEMFAALFFSPIPSPHHERPEVAPDLAAVALRLLARPREQRYATAEEAVEALMACAQASRNGRAELIELLAMRFAEHAPARPSRQRAVVAGTPTAEVLLLAPPHATPTAETLLAPAAAAGGTPRGEPALPAPRRARLLGAFAGASVLAAALTLGAARLWPRSGEPPTTAPASAAAAIPPPAPPAPQDAVKPPGTAEKAPPGTAESLSLTSQREPAPVAPPSAGASRARGQRSSAPPAAKRVKVVAPASAEPTSPEPRSREATSPVESATTKARPLTEAPNLLEASEPQ